MIISNIEIKNFKSFGPEGVSFALNPISAIVGENNAGKSNILLALDIFHNFSVKKITRNSFHGRDVSKPIEIKITYDRLDKDEIKLFRRHLSPDNTFLITQTITPEYNSNAEDDNSQQTTEDAGEYDEKVSVKEDKSAYFTRSAIDWLDEPPTTKRTLRLFGRMMP